jgi:hypothetical protein
VRGGDTFRIIDMSTLKNRKLWIPIAVSIPIAAICSYISMATGGRGFRTYVAAMLFYPVMMLSTRVFGHIPIALGIGALFFQIPFYGIAIGIAWVKQRAGLAIVVLLVLHLVAAGLAIRFVRYGKVSPLERQMMVLESP